VHLRKSLGFGLRAQPSAGGAVFFAGENLSEFGDDAWRQFVSLGIILDFFS